MNNNWFLVFVKVGYLTSFYVFFSIFYLHIFPDFEEENYTRALQVVLQLYQFLLNFRLFTTKEEKEAKLLLLLTFFFSVVSTLFLKNVVSIEGIVFIMFPLFCLLIWFFPSDVLPCAILIFYSLEKGPRAMGLFSSLSANNILSFLLLFGGTPPKIPLSLYHSECLFLVSRKRLLWWRFSARTGAANRHGVGCLHHFP